MTDRPLPIHDRCDGAQYEDSGRSPVSMFSCDASLQLKWSKNPPSPLDGDGFLSAIQDAIIEGVSSRRIVDAARWVIRTGDTFYGLCVVEMGPETRRFEVSIYPHTNDHIIAVATDLGINEPRERAVRSLSLELAHRTKNLMAVISSLATQTSRRFQSADDFKRRFLAQIGSLSLAHDAIAKTGWTGAPLQQIVRAQIENGTNPMRAAFSGDARDVMLSPNAAQNIAMVVHDLTSACKPGASFDVEAGFGDDGALRLSLTTELPVNQAGLWCDLLEKVAPLALDGTGTIEIDDTALRYQLTLSTDHFTRS